MPMPRDAVGEPWGISQQVAESGPVRIPSQRIVSMSPISSTSAALLSPASITLPILHDLERVWGGQHPPAWSYHSPIRRGPHIARAYCPA